MFLKACLNGARQPLEHPRLPVSAEQLALDAVAVRQLGAQAVHIHAKDEAGRDTLAASSVGQALTAIRAAAPGLAIGVTTGDWIASTPERLAAIANWQVLPEFASVNWHEPDAVALAEALLARGVAVEAGIFHPAAARAWSRWPKRESSTLRILIELPEGLDAAEVPSAAEEILAILSNSNTQLPMLLHGEGSSCWPAIHYALRHGFQLRLGLEDTLELPDGRTAPDNAALFLALNQLASTG
ncbi:3-keto-5-aminohexanoate cleavage protein [Psychromicrobium lacuslunae]|uniref:3-keto-5-aminohexanoate cleavage protein n=1 Tax=Psychromicrobium lacuslunae TaxID=1618207 RepID=A0A0D4BXS2_9MICC|nr:3-keto-5-aminohexanoate cleavage protein [Psychromicrobium lacuslunae]AJT40930.1 hypothetical protein UM93_04335 [Psychromicrobium lacuslunae]